MELIRSIRNMRAEMNVPTGKKAPLVLAADVDILEQVRTAESYILQLASAERITFQGPEDPIPDKAAKAHVRGIDAYLPLAGLIDLEKEVARIEKEIANTENELKRLTGKLSNPGFLAKAPADVVEKERMKLTENEAKLVSLRGHLELFK